MCFSLCVTDPTSISSSQVQDLANTFVRWFYEEMNKTSNALATPQQPTQSQQPNQLSPAAEDLSPEHFWPDASAKVVLGSNPTAVDETLEVSQDGAQVAQALTQLVRRFSLGFNPNLCSEGVRGVLDPTGLVVVTACGTLHNASTACGTFHQQFGLVRDPRVGNNWKIKYTQARLTSSQPTGHASLPSLAEFPALAAPGSKEVVLAGPD